MDRRTILMRMEDQAKGLRLLTRTTLPSQLSEKECMFD